MTAALPSSRSRTPVILLAISVTTANSPSRLHAERGAAAAGRLHIRIVELEARALQAFDIVDLGADQVHEAHLVDHDPHPLDLDLAIDLGGLVEVQVVRETS